MHCISGPQLLRSVGKPYPGVSLETRAPDWRALHRGEHGEIWIRPLTLMASGANNAQKTREVLIDVRYASGGGYLAELQFLRPSLAGFKIPRDLRIVAGLP